MLTCVDPTAVSLYMLNLHADSEMTQIPLQVTNVNFNILFGQEIAQLPASHLKHRKRLFFSLWILN